MANGLYGKFKELLLGGDIDLAADDLKVVLVDTADYTVNLATDDFLADIAAGGRVATSANLGDKTITLGVFDAGDVTFSAVTGDVSEALVIYKDTTDADTSPLIAYIDTVSSGLPVTPNGGDITITWDSGANKIFAL